MAKVYNATQKRWLVIGFFGDEPGDPDWDWWLNGDKATEFSLEAAEEIAANERLLTKDVIKVIE